MKRLEILADNIKHQAIELAVEYFESPDDNITFSFTHITPTGCTLEVTAVCEVINYHNESGDYYSPPEIDYDIEFLNANIEDERTNVTNLLNQFLN